MEVMIMAVCVLEIIVLQRIRIKRKCTLIFSRKSCGQVVVLVLILLGLHLSPERLHDYSLTQLINRISEELELYTVTQWQ